MKHLNFVIITFLFLNTSCSKSNLFKADFDNVNNRVWVGKDFWSIPLEDWKVEDGKLVCTGNVPDSRVNLLTHVLSPDAGNFTVSAKFMLLEMGDVPGSAGLLLGIHDKEDPDVRAACYFGGGIKAVVSAKGYAFLNGEKVQLPENFGYSDFDIVVKGTNNSLTMLVSDINGFSTELNSDIDGIQGLIAVANNVDLDKNEKNGNSNFAFDDLKLSGSKVFEKSEHQN